MLQLLKIELRRAIKNKYLFISISIGCLISVTHVLQNILPLTQYLSDTGDYGIPPHSVFNKWIGGEVMTLQPSMFFILFPILACLPFSDTYYTDRKSGYIKNVFIRTKKINYYVAKYIAAFISGGVSVIVPLLLNLMLTAMVLPSILPDPSTGFFSIFSNSMWCDIFYSDPYLYIFMYLAIDFVFAGLFAAISLVFSDIVTNRFFVILAPFIVYIFIFTFCNLIGHNKYNPFVFLNPTQQTVGITFSFIFSVMMITWVLSKMIFVIRGIKSETF